MYDTLSFFLGLVFILSLHGLVQKHYLAKFVRSQLLRTARQLRLTSLVADIARFGVVCPLHSFPARQPRSPNRSRWYYRPQYTSRLHVDQHSGQLSLRASFQARKTIPSGTSADESIRAHDLMQAPGGPLKQATASIQLHPSRSIITAHCT